MSNGKISNLTALPHEVKHAKERPPIFLTLGMHRSGTSAIARGLAALDINLGDQLLGPSKGDNDKGFWEDKDILALEERLLVKAGTAHDSLAPFTADFTSQAFAEERVEASALLQEKIAAFGTFGFKNPRSGLLLDFWKCVIGDLGLQPRFVIAVRNPLEVAKSLQRRNHFPLERSLILWAKYCVSIVEKTQDEVRVFVNYEQIIRDPEAELIRMSEGLKLSRDRLDAKALDDYANGFLDSRLKRITVSPNELDRNTDIPVWLVDFYKALRIQGSLPPRETSFPQDVLDNAKAGLAGINPLLAIYDNAEALRADAARRLHEAEQTSEFKLQEKQTLIDDLTAQVSELQVQIANATHAELELNASLEQLDVLRFEHAASREENERLHADSEHLRGQIAAHLVNLEALEGQKARAEQASIENEGLREELSLAQASARSAHEALNRAVEFEQAFQELQREFDQVSSRLAEEQGTREAIAEDLLALQTASLAETLSLQAVIERLQERTLHLTHVSEQYDMSQAQVEALETALHKTSREIEEITRQFEQKLADAELESTQRIDDLVTSLSTLETTRRSEKFEHDETLRLMRQALLEQAEEHERKLRRVEDERDQAAQRGAVQSKQFDALTAELKAAQSTMQDQQREITRLHNVQETISSELHGERSHRQSMQTAFLNSQRALRLTHRSMSWQFTRPVRSIGRAIRDPRASLKSAARRVARRVWHAIPMSPERRGGLAKRIVYAFPFVFKSTNWYQAFKSADEVSVKQLPVDRSLTSTGSLRHEQFLPYPAASAPVAVKARAFAFYLPQFHAIPENDAWWGEGFTEWTKVAPAIPKFEGHYQPHVPIDLGYYDLKRNPAIMRQQADLADAHGLSGFCFYFYWFGGTTLLELPIENYRQDATIEFPYCLCWANENWSRRWDGRDDDVLIQQDHSAADDFAFIQHISKYLKDPKYSRIDGRPLLLVYRPSLLPNALETTQRWRQFARENGIGELYLAYTQSFEAENPAVYGFDAAVEFPPNNSGLEKDNSLVKPLSEPFDLNIYDWTALEKRSENYPVPDYPLFRGVTPSWDNTARRPDTGAVMLGSQPDRYGHWLKNAIKDTQARFADPEERLVFINAWNEWAEGAHLEPDAKYGYAWLHETRKALAAQTEAPQRQILVVTHDLHKHGAQYLSMNFLRSLKHDYGYEVAAIAGGDGALADQYRELGTLEILDRNQVSTAEIEMAVASLKVRGFEAAIVNSCASGWIVPYLDKQGIRSVGLVHELPNIIRDMNLEPNLRAMNEFCDKVIFAATMVRDRSAIAAELHSGWSNPVIRPQGLYKSEGIADISEKDRAREKICQQLGVGPLAKLVLGVGYADYRKGLDIFVKWAIASTHRWSDVHFVWLGKLAPDMEAATAALLQENTEAESHLHFPGFVDNTFDFYLAADLYALTSREDPFPSTALEALNAATPVILVRGCSGIEDLDDNDGVHVLGSADEAEFVDAAAAWLDDSSARTRAGQSGRAEMQSRFGFVSFVGEVLDLLDEPWPDVSVIVPNYNYAKFMDQRLGSILNQSMPPRELIFLDDASTDDSVAVAKEILKNAPINIKYDLNQANSGSVFAQWRRGVEQASGEYVWVAEADDWADSDFLKVTTRALRQAGVVFAYTQSNQVDQDGNILARDYLDYVREIDRDLWKRDYQRSGREEAIRAMSVKNVAPNVSGMLFRREALLKVLKEFEADILSYRVAGDWCVYANLLRFGDVAFVAEPLNYHRRHSESVTISRFSLADLAEIAKMQIYVDSIFGVPADMRSKADAYLDKLVDDFDLASKFDAQSIADAKRGITNSQQVIAEHTGDRKWEST